MAYLSRVSAMNSIKKVDAFTGFNGVTTTFPIQVGGAAYSPNSALALLVSLGGVIQEPNIDYNVSGSNIVFTVPPAATDQCFAVILAYNLVTGSVQLSDVRSELQNQTAVGLNSIGGTGNAITAVAAQTISGYSLHQTFRFVVGSTNGGGGVTINIDGIGAKAITKNGSTALDAGDLVAGSVVQITYDGTRFQLISGIGSSAMSAATGAGSDKVFVENDMDVTGSYTIGQNTMNTCTISIATPGVITLNNSFVAGQRIFFRTTGTLPTGIVANQQYFVSATGLSTTSFQISATRGGASIATSGSQSGTHSCGKLRSVEVVGPLWIAAGATLTVPTGARLVVS